MSPASHLFCVKKSADKKIRSCREEKRRPWFQSRRINSRLFSDSRTVVFFRVFITCACSCNGCKKCEIACNGCNKCDIASTYVTNSISHVISHHITIETLHQSTPCLQPVKQEGICLCPVYQTVSSRPVTAKIGWYVVSILHNWPSCSFDITWS